MLRRLRERALAHSSPATWSSLAAAIVPALGFAYAGYAQRWAGDDGFINLRVVSQLMHGNGFVFNAGERSEAVTSAAWVLLLWLFGELGCSLDSAAWIVALALSAVGLLLAGLASARITDGPRDGSHERTLVLPLGVLAYAAIPVAWDYATSALENGLGLAFLGTAYWLLARVVSAEVPRRQPAVAAFIGLAPLVRPDYALYALPLLALLLGATRTWKARALTAACAALPGGTFQIFRMGYFASLVPNTAFAKEAFESRWDQGLLYLDNALGPYHLAAPLAVVLLTLSASVVELVQRQQLRRALVPLALASGGLLHIAYVVRVGGDFMHGRMLLPGLFAIFAAGGVLRVRLGTLAARVSSLSAFVLVAGWCVVCASITPVSAHGINDERRWWAEVSGKRNPTHLKHYARHPFSEGPKWVKEQIAGGCPGGLSSLRDDSRDVCTRVLFPDSLDGVLADHGPGALIPLDPHDAPPEVVAVYAFRPLGISSRIMGLRINLTDSYGLADPLAARIELPERGRPGHEKIFDTVWVTAKHAAPGATSDPRVAVAKRALSCGLLRELYEATHQPLTLERFVKNLGLSFRLHGVRLPSDPSEAVRRFCGA
jgi:arabinofuranosyltransferase